MKTQQTTQQDSNTPKHTPGPWTCDPLTERATQKTYGAFRVYSGGEDGLPVTRTEANARLIAAAPELLDVAKELAGLNPYAPNATTLLAAIENAKVALSRATLPQS